MAHSKTFDMDDKVASRRSSMESSIIDIPATTTTQPISSSPSSSRTASTSAISRTSTTSSTKSKRQKVKSFFKRMGSGALHSLAYYNAIEYSPAAIQYYESKKYDGRTPDQVLNDIYGVHCYGCYW